MAEDKWADIESRFGPAQQAAISAKGRDYAIRTVLAEAADQRPIGMAAVAHVINNRVRRGGFGEGLEGVITKPYAFEPWLHAGKGTGNDPLRYDPASPQYQTAAKIVDAVFAGQIPDPTRGATHFYSPAGQQRLASIDNRKLVPDWASSEAHRASIGGHEFYAPEGVAPGTRVIEVSRPAPKEYQIPDYLRAAEEQTGGYLLPSAAPPMRPPAGQIQLKNVEMAPPVPIPQEPWGAGSSFLTGATSALTGGFGDPLKAAATVRAGYEAATGQLPADQGFMQRRKELAGQYQQQREAYQAEYPKTHMLAETGGALVGSIAPMERIGRGAKLAAEAVGRAAPVVKPALQAAERFVTGQGAMAAPGVSGAFGRGASYATQGALQGAQQALLTRELQPEDTSLTGNVLAGGLAGAASGLVFNPMIGRMVAPLTAPISNELRQMAINANEKFGLNIRPTQVSAGMKKFDERVVAPHINEAQVAKFNEELAKQVGLEGQVLTRDAVEQAKNKFGQELEDIAKTSSMKPARDFYKALGDIRAEVYDTTFDGNPLRSKIDSLLYKLYNEVSPTGVLDGQKFRALVKRDGLIDKEFYAANPALAHDIRDLMFDMFQVSDPKRASAYNMARNNYRKLNAISPLTGESGVVDPTKVLGRVDRAKIKGDFRELASAGEYLSPITKLGGVREAPREGGREWWKYAAGAGGGISALAEGIPMARQALDYLEISPLHLAGPAAGLAALHYLGSKGAEAAMQSPTINRLILQGRFPNIVTPTENILARGAGEVGAQVGAGKGR